MSEERFLSTEEVAERLQVDEQTIRRWIKSGKLEAFKPGREWRIPPSALAVLQVSYGSKKARYLVMDSEEFTEMLRSIHDLDEILEIAEELRDEGKAARESEGDWIKALSRFARVRSRIEEIEAKAREAAERVEELAVRA